MFYLTVISRQGTEPYSQVTADQWLQALYNNQPIVETTEPVIQTDGFLRTYTRYVNSYHKEAEDIPRILSGAARIHTLIQSFLAEGHNLNDMASEYETFYIPKHSGGMREINAPKPELKNLMREIKSIFETTFKVLYHNTAYAYCKGRSCKDALIVHQKNESRWFLKMDLKDFFTNCDATFIHKQLQQLYPFTILYRTPGYRVYMEELVQLCILHGGLPQGTPLSPMLTNLIMIPLDFKINAKLFNYEKSHYVYTRYADDLLISNEYSFEYLRIVGEIRNIFAEEAVPFRINDLKTRYGSSAGRNWNLGLMLNKDNKITIGHKRKERLRAGVNNFLRDFTAGNFWSTIDLQRLLGNLSYLESVEPDYCQYILTEACNKYALDWKTCIKQIL